MDILKNLFEINFNNLFFSLLEIILLIFILLFFINFFSKSKYYKKKSIIFIHEIYVLDSNSKIVILSIKKIKFILGVTKEKITLLHKYNFFENKKNNKIYFKNIIKKKNK
ncbi:flagellar biosynthetic protein FliO [Buchnera aphidicola]|uniref:flagellar biosynthetic protein FliO n=1 Tax=Buchnera aphidicola TaxID=9 RepID=UPI0031B8A195